jgi:multimeric flavodoxin WrbA
MSLLYPQILQAAGIVLVSPTHTYNITALMKAFIDRLYCFYEFADTRPRAWKSRLAGQGRRAVIVAVCEQPGAKNMGFTLEAMRLPLESHDIEVVADVAAFGLFDRGAVKHRPEVLEQARAAGRKLAESLC